jgi:cell division protein FtsN
VTAVLRAVAFAGLFAVGFLIGFNAAQRGVPLSAPAAVQQGPTPTPSPSPARDPPPQLPQPPAPTPRAALPPPAAASAYRVQVGAFGNRSNADALAAALRREGFAATVLSNTLFRVVLGPYASRSLATHAAAQLHRRGHPAIVLPAR